MAAKKSYQWVSNNINPLKRTLSKKMISSHIDHVHQRPLVATLLPVNVPDWSKILGRTLKGRDLSRVRDAIFKVTGFED
ncbi:hypothetical protein LIER_40944 [Lithospermum erythrorhizon]|uniref:Uncharacterized protein n=1 Tax=Lithospermum erythrorhizon TaxID=34254 RepID=A0AAV3R232_LITER